MSKEGMCDKWSRILLAQPPDTLSTNIHKSIHQDLRATLHWAPDFQKIREWPASVSDHWISSFFRIQIEQPKTSIPSPYAPWLLVILIVDSNNLPNKSRTYSCRYQKTCFLDPKIICQKKGSKAHDFRIDKKKFHTKTVCIPSNSVMLGIQEQIIGSGGQRIRRRQDQDELVKYAIIVVDPKKSHFLITPEHTTPSQFDSECISEATIKHWNNWSIVPPGRSIRSEHHCRWSSPPMPCPWWNQRKSSQLWMMLKFVLETTLEIQCHTLKFAVVSSAWRVTKQLNLSMKRAQWPQWFWSIHYRSQA